MSEQRSKSNLPKYLATLDVVASSREMILSEALSIAWEALEKVRTSSPCKEDHESFNTPGQMCDQRLSEDAMRRIESLGGDTSKASIEEPEK